MVPHDPKLQVHLQHYIQMPYGARRLARICIQLFTGTGEFLLVCMFPRFIVVRFLRFNGVGCPRQMAVAKAERATL